MHLARRAASVAFVIFQFEIVVYIFKEEVTLSRPKSSRSIAAQIERDYRANLKLIQESMKELEPKTKAWLERALAISKIQLQYRDERAARGLDPVNLGGAAVKKYVFIATVDEQPLQVDAARKAWEAEMDAEFSSSTPSPSLPAQAEAANAEPVVPEPPKKKTTKKERT